MRPNGDQVTAEANEILDSLIDFIDPHIEKFGDMSARGLTAVPYLKNLIQLAQGESHGLAGSDELETLDDRWVVVPVPRLGAFRGCDQSLVFVEANRRSGQTDLPCNFTDLHRRELSHLTFNRG